MRTSRGAGGQVMAPLGRPLVLRSASPAPPPPAVPSAPPLRSVLLGLVGGAAIAFLAALARRRSEPVVLAYEAPHPSTYGGADRSTRPLSRT